MFIFYLIITVHFSWQIVPDRLSYVSDKKGLPDIRVYVYLYTIFSVIHFLKKDNM